MRSALQEVNSAITIFINKRISSAKTKKEKQEKFRLWSTTSIVTITNFTPNPTEQSFVSHDLVIGGKHDDIRLLSTAFLIRFAVLLGYTSSKKVDFSEPEEQALEATPISS